MDWYSSDVARRYAEAQDRIPFEEINWDALFCSISSFDGREVTELVFRKWIISIVQKSKLKEFLLRLTGESQVWGLSLVCRLLSVKVSPDWFDKETIALLLKGLLNEKTFQGVIRVLTMYSSAAPFRRALLELLQAEESFASDSTLQFRVYELISRICGLSGEALSDCVACGMLDGLLATALSDDLLLQVNAVQLIGFVGNSQVGIAHLVKAGVFEGLLKLLGVTEAGLTAQVEPFLVTGTLRTISHLYFRLFSSVAREKWEPAVSSLLSGLLSRLELLLQEEEWCGDASDALATIASTPEGMQSLSEGLLTAWQLSIVECHDVAARASRLHGLARVVASHESPPQGAFKCLLTAPIVASAVDILQTPFDEPRQFVWRFLACMCGFPWGLALVCRNPAILEAIHNRGSEPSKEAFDAKFEAVVAIVANGESHLDADTFRKMVELRSLGSVPPLPAGILEDVG